MILHIDEFQMNHNKAAESLTCIFLPEQAGDTLFAHPCASCWEQKQM